jgi:hypothetical protein
MPRSAPTAQERQLEDLRPFRALIFFIAIACSKLSILRLAEIFVDLLTGNAKFFRAAGIDPLTFAIVEWGRLVGKWRELGTPDDRNFETEGEVLESGLKRTIAGRDAVMHCVMLWCGQQFGSSGFRPRLEHVSYVT